MWRVGWSASRFDLVARYRGAAPWYFGRFTFPPGSLPYVYRGLADTRGYITNWQFFGARPVRGFPYGEDVLPDQPV